MHANDDFGVADSDDITVGQLPFLYRCVVDGGAVSGVQVRQQCQLAVPSNLHVAPGHSGVRQPELRILATADHVRALAQLVGSATAIIELQRDRGSGGGVLALIGRWCVGTVSSLGLLAVVLLAIVVIRSLGRRRRRIAALLVAAVVRLAVLGPAVRGAVSGLPVTGLVGVSGTRFEATVIGCGWPVAGRRAVGRLTAVPGRRRGRPITLVVSGGAVAGRSRAGIVSLAVSLGVALFGVAPLLRVALAGRVTLLVIRRVALVGRIRRARWLGCRGPRILLRPAVLIVVVLVAGTSLALAAAVLVVGHRWHSWFCGVRMGCFCCSGRVIRLAGVGVGVDDGSGAELAGVQTLGFLESQDYFTVGLPSLLLNISPKMPGERFCGEFAVCADLPEVGRADRDDVIIGR